MSELCHRVTILSRRILTVKLLCYAVSLFYDYQVNVGMELTDVVPRGTNEHTFLEAQSQYFGFYDMHVVTKVLVTHNVQLNAYGLHFE